ncbi:MAG: hypothetical protein E5W70_22990 [Mesorhizobium sp.]|uniref:hypothetical protein n=1 Tax=Mesorhizobium sp. TaxID=1871066 RepID=UPI00121C0439|nr:hypothetical protein [Mesorhizobium sp.]TIT20053.1 MAG: hypothetical protein E5W70_22990 [Mesorhizobium sp.]TKB30894.1 MAG: hypothetical protein E5W69_02700 [Mesorhizobium sp.]
MMRVGKAFWSAPAAGGLTKLQSGTITQRLAFLVRARILCTAAGLEGSQMSRQRFNRTRLSPHDLAICERVFDQVCADEHIDPLSLDAEALAVMIVAIFRNVTTNERELLEEVRSLRRSKGTEKAH